MLSGSSCSNVAFSGAADCTSSTCFDGVLRPGICCEFSECPTTANIHNAVASFFSDPAAAQVTYGPIASWHTAAVISFKYLFCGENRAQYCGTAYNLGNVIKRAASTVGILNNSSFNNSPIFCKDTPAVPTRSTRTLAAGTRRR
jgi:hypothetical protein